MKLLSQLSAFESVGSFDISDCLTLTFVEGRLYATAVEVVSSLLLSHQKKWSVLDAGWWLLNTFSCDTQIRSCVGLCWRWGWDGVDIHEILQVATPPGETTQSVGKLPDHWREIGCQAAGFATSYMLGSPCIRLSVRCWLTIFQWANFVWDEDSYTHRRGQGLCQIELWLIDESCMLEKNHDL